MVLAVSHRRRTLHTFKSYLHIRRGSLRSTKRSAATLSPTTAPSLAISNITFHQNIVTPPPPVALSSWLSHRTITTRYSRNKERFSQFHDKIIHFVMDDADLWLLAEKESQEKAKGKDFWEIDNKQHTQLIERLSRVMGPFLDTDIIISMLCGTRVLLLWLPSPQSFPLHSSLTNPLVDTDNTSDKLWGSSFVF